MRTPSTAPSPYVVQCVAAIEKFLALRRMGESRDDAVELSGLTEAIGGRPAPVDVKQRQTGEEA